MNKQKTFQFIGFFFALTLLASCAATSHPNEKIIIGKWRPLKVEKVVDSSAIEAAASAGSGNTATQKSGTSRPVTEGAAGRKDFELDRLVQAEMRATMEIFPDKTAVKNYPGKQLNATWKMKGKGTKIVAKNLENKMNFVIEILEISKEQVIVLQHAPVGDVKITYERVFDAN